MHGGLLTVEEVADILRLTIRTVQGYIRAGDIPSVRLGHRTVRVRQSDLDAYLASRGQSDANG